MTSSGRYWRFGSIGVTGSGGFIGRAVCDKIAREGWDFVHMDLPDFDVRQPFDLPDGVTTVIHLAGVLGTHELFDTVDLAIDTNVKGTVNVLEAARRAGANYVGICMPDVFPSIYTATKRAAVGFERAYHNSCGVPVSRVRAFNAFGPGQKHGPGHPQKIVPTFAVHAWHNKPIPIWGDGEQTVDLIHTDDLATMLVQASFYGDDETFDGGTGYPLTVNQVAAHVLAVTGSTAGVQHLPMRRGETPTKIVASGEGWDLLDWRPEFNWDRFAETVYWYKDYPL